MNGRKKQYILMFTIIGILLGAPSAYAYYIYYPSAGYGGITTVPGGSVYYTPNTYYPATFPTYVNPYNPYQANSVPANQYNQNPNTCPLQPSHYDAAGNWIAATRVCPK